MPKLKKTTDMIIKCEECGGDISNKAPHCPHCGAVRKKIKADINVWRINPPEQGLFKTIVNWGTFIFLILAAITICILLFMLLLGVLGEIDSL